MFHYYGRLHAEHDKPNSFVFESEILIEAIRLKYGTLSVAVDMLCRPGGRPSYFRPVLDIARITGMVGWKLIGKGMYPMGLYRAMFQHANETSSHADSRPTTASLHRRKL